jgi:hypothetical protein
MALNQDLLSGTSTVTWSMEKPPSGAIPEYVFLGRDDANLGPLQIALASVSTPPSKETMRALHQARKGKSTIQLVVGAVMGDRIWIFGPDERTQVIESLPLDQGCRQLQSALDEPNALAAYTRLGQFRRSLDTTSLVGVTNSGLFASYHIRENVPKRTDWDAACAKAKPWLNLRTDQLIKALGFKSEKTAGNALLLTSGTPQSKAVAILLDESEQFDSTSARHTGISPVAFGLNVAARQGVPWLFVLRKDQIRIYPAKDGIGVGQKGQVETYLEIDLAAIDSERAGLLALIFSADALEPNGTAQELLEGSQRFASQLGLRLRERIYEHVVPQLSKSVAEHLRDQGTTLDSAGLSLAYRLTLRILFRLLFQAYAEDRGLLPAGRNEGYDANSLKTIAKRIIDTPAEQFGKSKTLWFDLVQVWDAIDEGNETWNVPAYNGGLFGTDPEIHPEGALIEKLGVHDDVLGPVLQHLLIDISEDNVPGPVDFRSLSVREFGTIYEGLLESSLSVATQNLTVDSTGAWVPTTTSEPVLANIGEVYFHSASGERKATGSYFTPTIVVDHLISRSLDQALDTHLAKIKKYLDSGDEAAAAKNFFDFRVVDLAMGSGHFLVAAVDRIEAKMRTFLAEKETQVPGINAELHRLALAAKHALGKDESVFGEVEPAALLRRQIARRCIYGLDINPLAVELSRLAIWIHTFVPGLPMSSLDHGLVCANSLTGIGTVDEALQALQPDQPKSPLKLGHAIPVSLFEDAIIDNLEKAKVFLIEAANSDEAVKAEVKAAALISQNAKKAAEGTRAIFDAAVAARLGLIKAELLTDDQSISKAMNNKEVSETVRALNPAHMPYLFPEVFLRTNPGFDVLIGNPPWEKLHVEEHQWWGLHIPGLRGMQQGKRNQYLAEFKNSRPDLMVEYERDVLNVDNMRSVISKGPYLGLGAAHLDLFQAFSWRNWQLLNATGRAGLVLPRGALSGSSLQIWREEIIRNGKFIDVCFLINSNGWIFEGVHQQYSIGLTVFSKSNDHTVSFSGPFTSANELVTGRDELVTVSGQEFVSWSETAAFPLLPDSISEKLFLKMRKNPRFDTKRIDFEYRAIQGDLNATTDKDVLEFDTEAANSRIPVVAGGSFNLWNPDFNSPYAYADNRTIREFVFRKVTAASRNSRSAYFGMHFKSTEELPFDAPRIAFRDVTNSIDARTVIACLLPPKVLATHKAPLIVRRAGNETSEAYLLGIMSSIPFDWYMRRWVSLTLSFELLNPAPIPEFKSDNSICVMLAEAAAELAAVDKRFDRWAKKVGVTSTNYKTPEEKADLEAKIDALSSYLYGLSEDDLLHIYKTHRKGWTYHERSSAAIQHFRAIGRIK